MSRALAVLVDVAAVAILGYLGFRLALLVEPCSSVPCPLLMPLVIVFVLILLVLYFVAGHFLWGATPGEAVTRGRDR